MQKKSIRLNQAIKKLQMHIESKTYKLLDTKSVLLTNTGLLPDEPNTEQNQIYLPSYPKAPLVTRSRKMFLKNTVSRNGNDESIEEITPRRRKENYTNVTKRCIISPVCEWDSKEMIDYSQYDRMILEKTLKIHQGQLPFEIKPFNITKNRLPIDLFDCKSPIGRSETILIEQGIQTQALTQYMDTNKQLQWVPCFVNSFNDDSNMYSITISTPKEITKEVSRFNLLFLDETLEFLSERKQVATSLRDFHERYIRTEMFLDSIDLPNDILSFISPKLLDSLSKDALSLIIRVQKAEIINGYLKIYKNPELLGVVNNNGLDLNLYHQNQFADDVNTIQLDNIKSKIMSLSNNIIGSCEYMGSLIGIRKIILKYSISIKNALEKFINESVILFGDWNEIHRNILNEIRQYMISCSNDISNEIYEHMGLILDSNDLLKFSSTDKNHPYLLFFSCVDSKFSRFCKLFGIIMETFFRDLIDFNFLTFTSIFEMDLHIPEIEFDQIGDLSLIGHRISQKSLKNQKILMKMDFGDDYMDIQGIVTDMFSIIPDELFSLVNPLRVLFEKVGPEEVLKSNDSRYENFLIDNDFHRFLPPIGLFNSKVFFELYNQSKSIFNSSFDQQFKRILSIFPVLSENMNYNWTKIQNINPINNNHHGFLLELKSTKNSMLSKMAHFIRIGYIELNFIKHRTMIVDYIDQQVSTMLGMIEFDIISKMDSLNSDYNEMNNLLKMELRSIDNCVSLYNCIISSKSKRICFNHQKEIIKEKLDLLFEYSFGIDTSILKKEMNLLLWPFLIEIEIGKAISSLERNIVVYLREIPEKISSINAEIENTIVLLKQEKNNLHKQQRQEYLDHLHLRKEQISQMQLLLNNVSYDEFTEPRIVLWRTVNNCQSEFKIWENTAIRLLDFCQIKKQYDSWLSILRKLTSEFKNDKQSLRLLISTKNDIERFIPIMKGCAQIVSSKVLQSHKLSIANLLGEDKYEEMTISHLKNVSDIFSKLDKIDQLYKQSKLEDKTDMEIISTQTIIKNSQFVFENNIITNLDGLNSILHEKHNSLVMILQQEGIDESKVSVSLALIEKLHQMITLIELIGSIQNLSQSLVLIKSLASMDNEIIKFNNCISEFYSVIDFLKHYPSLFDFAQKDFHSIRLQNIRSQLKEIHVSYMEVLTSLRNKVPRLLLIPDTHIDLYFTKDITQKIFMLGLLFPSIKSFVLDSNNLIRSIVVCLEDKFDLVHPISTSLPIGELVQVLESELSLVLKTIFWRYINKEIPLDLLPLQLCFLAVLLNCSETKIPFSGPKSHYVNCFIQAICSSGNPLKAIVHDRSIKITNGISSIDYGFQFVDSDSYLFSSINIEKISSIISNINNNLPILLFSEKNSLAVLTIQQLSFVCGRHCMILHSTLSTDLSRISTIIDLLQSIHIWTCLSDIELLSSQQMFELAVLVKRPYFCTATFDKADPILSVGKQFIKIPSIEYELHINQIGISIFATQPEMVAFSSQTLSKYIHPISIIKQFETQIQKNYPRYSLDYVSDIKAILPSNVYNQVKDIVFDEVESKQSKFFIQVVKSMISTTDFLKGVHSITRQLQSGKKIFMVTGPQFSGISTCIKAAAQSLSYPFFSLAFASKNWIRDLNKALLQLDDRPTVFHVIAAFDDSFLSHISSLRFGSSICEGSQSLLGVSMNSILIFECMSPVLYLNQVPIPLVSFSTPLIRSGDLLNYWITNLELQISQQIIDEIKELITALVSGSLQLYVFFQIFSIYINQYHLEKSSGLDSLIGYCAFWSKVFDLPSIDDWIGCSDFIKSKIPSLNRQEHIFELVIDHQLNNFAFTHISCSRNSFQFDPNLIAKFSENLCGPISFTNVPTSQFLHSIDFLVPLINNGKSCCLIGPKGSGKTTMIKYLSSYYFREPLFLTLYFNGKDTTPESFFKILLSVCSVNVEGIVEPKDEGVCLCIIDPFPIECDLYGIILSILKTGNAIIRNEIKSFRRIVFLLSVENISYQLSSSCFPLRIQPYTDSDLLYLSKEILLRILVHYNFPQAHCVQYQQQFSKVLPEIIKICRDNDSQIRFLHTFCKIIRSVESINPNFFLDLSEFLLFILNSSISCNLSITKPQKHFEKSIVLSPKSGDKSFKYIQIEKNPSFSSVLSPFVHLYVFRIPLTPLSLEFSSFILNTLVLPCSHSIILNDLNIDYECITKFCCSIVSSKFILFNSQQQIPGIFREALVSSQPILLYSRIPDPVLLDLIVNGLKSSHQHFLSSILSDESFIPESGIGNSFPYCPLADGTKKDSNKRKEDQSYGSFSQINSVRHYDFHYIELNLFKNLHIVFSISHTSEISKNIYSIFKVWDKSNEIPQTENAKINQLLSSLSSYSIDGYVPVISQSPAILQMFDYLIQRVQQYHEQRKVFLKEVIIVIESIEASINDSKQRISDIEEQIKIDEMMQQANQKAVENARIIVQNCSGDVARAQIEFDSIANENKKIMDYKDRDESKTLAEYNIATKRAQKAFTAEQQYNLYVQQNPSDKIVKLFSAYCILHSLTPRNGSDYWPEARGILKSGRIGQSLLLFDPNNISPEVLEKFDVVMQDPEICDTNFPHGTASRYLSKWLDSVHKHTKRTKFNPSVNPKISEILKELNRKEEDLKNALNRLNEANKNLEESENVLSSLSSKIYNQKVVLENLIIFNSTAIELSGVFPLLMDDLNRFSEGERRFGTHIPDFVLKSVVDCSITPLFDPLSQKRVKEVLYDKLDSLGVDSTFYVSLKGIIGSDNPLIISLFSSDRVIVVFDPFKTAYNSLGAVKGHINPVISHYEFQYTNPRSLRFRTDVAEASEKGRILVIDNSETIINHQFFCAIANPNVTTSVLNGQTIVLDNSFKVILLVGQPPKILPPHMSFIAELTFSPSRIESILSKDRGLPTLSLKKDSAEMNLHAQKENLFVSLQRLCSQLKDIHSMNYHLFEEAKLQHQLLSTSMDILKETQMVYDHALDGFPWVREQVPMVMAFFKNLQSLCKISSLYLFSFEKCSKMLESWDSNCPLIEYLYSFASGSILSTHRRSIPELQNVVSLSLSHEKLNIIHSTDLSKSTKFFLGLSDESEYFFLNSKSKFETIKEELKNHIRNGRIIVVSFFEESVDSAEQLESLFDEIPLNTWDQNTRVYIHINTYYYFPTNLVRISQVIALE